MNRRAFFSTTAAGLAAAGLVSGQTKARKGRLKQSAILGCFDPRKSGMTLDDMCREAVRLGLKGLEIVPIKDWPTLKKYGLVPSLCPSGFALTDGMNTRANHAKLEPIVRDNIAIAAEFGAPIVNSHAGNRRGMSDEEGISNCVLFLNKVKAMAEDKGVTLCMELLNSKVNHKDNQCDHTAFGVEVCKRVNSPRVKLLYDIYHMQIMEGDIIRTIKDNFQYLAHFHTAGVPGRHEIDTDSQELSYRPIAQTLVDLGYTGFLGHEYTPLRDPLKSLDEAITLCDV
jgi:hydroxypyruvate isomerase